MRQYTFHPQQDAVVSSGHWKLSWNPGSSYYSIELSLIHGRPGGAGTNLGTIHHPNTYARRSTPPAPKKALPPSITFVSDHPNNQPHNDHRKGDQGQKEDASLHASRAFLGGCGVW